ncbi:MULTISPECIES: hypothetical protein [Comamonas]|jgi:hypothetical protein|uniref:hypothetical protein n=1 Tax=Comamonas TaxID=283 RepID=UPI0015841AC6|nr:MULTISPECIES: hypothetical protein [Comamonas]
MKYMLLATAAALALAGCATQSADPMAKEAAPYVAKPDYEHAMVCDTRYDDLQKCEATLKSLCGERGFLDLRIRPLREPGASVDSSTHRLLQLQCKARAAK